MVGQERGLAIVVVYLYLCLCLRLCERKAVGVCSLIGWSMRVRTEEWVYTLYNSVCEWLVAK